MASHAEILDAVCRCQAGWPFLPQFAGTCALTGVRFQTWDKIRAAPTASGTVYVKAAALGEALISDGATEENHRPFDATAAQAWLEDPRTFRFFVLDHTGKPVAWRLTEGLPEGPARGTCSWAQFASRTRKAVYMVRTLKRSWA